MHIKPFQQSHLGFHTSLEKLFYSSRVKINLTFYK